MSWSLRSQMLMPFAALLILFLCQLASRQTDYYVRSLDRRENQQPILLAKQLGPLVEEDLPGELVKLERDNPGWRFTAFREQRLLASTISLTPNEMIAIRAFPPIPSNGTTRSWIVRVSAEDLDSYFLTVTRVPAWPHDARLVTFYSYDHAVTLNRQAKRRIFAVTSVFVILLIAGVTWYSGRLSRRVRLIQQQVTQIAEGDFEHTIEVGGRDEVDELAQAVNSMAGQLQRMQQTIRMTERTRLQAQLASGIAHELRNGIHSARLSLEVFREACRLLTLPSECMLENAAEQLQVTETLVRRLLSTGKAQKREQITRPLVDVLRDVVTMVAPICCHLEIELVTGFATDLDYIVQDAESIQAAIVNLSLNGIEAMGRHGELRIEVAANGRVIEIHVRDTGPGPDPTLADQLFEPFVTSKPEGIGLGLVQAQQAAEFEGGAVKWTRHNGRTDFVITLPMSLSPARADVTTTAGAT